MIQRSSEMLSQLYVSDETAWLEAMADLVRRGAIAELDLEKENLAEYLHDMARRDRREVKSRLTVLMSHLLEWQFQPEGRSGSWRGTIVSQRRELLDLAGGGVLRLHAEAVLHEAYANAVEQAAAETGLPRESFPATCPFSFPQLLADQDSSH